MKRSGVGTEQSREEWTGVEWRGQIRAALEELSGEDKSRIKQNRVERSRSEWSGVGQRRAE